jgi:hypothetical protein
VQVEHIVVFSPDPRRDGTYSHGAQLERRDGYFHLSWNNAAYNEDQDGMHVLYTSSADGRSWSSPVDLFPSMPASQFGCNTNTTTNNNNNNNKPDDSTSDGGGELAGAEAQPFCYDKIHHHTLP